MNHLDLFSGIGGFSLAAELAGFKTVGFAETDLYCSRVLAQHWPHVVNYGDVKLVVRETVHVPIHVLTGGFPCQPFSVAGKQKGRSDDRYLWPEFRRIIHELKPSNVLIENVPGLVAMELDNILTDLETAGYACGSFIIPACAANAPHRRDRLWVVAHAVRERCGSWRDIVTERILLFMQDGNFEAHQKRWSNLQYESWETFNPKKWLRLITDSTSERLPREGAPRQSLHTKTDTFGKTNNAVNDSFNAIIGWEKDKPPISGVDDGLPDRMDRIKALGNSIVPAVAYPFLKFIYELEGLNSGVG